MFCSIYKSTTKNILRSGTIYLIFFILIFITVYSMAKENYSVLNPTTGEMISDTDPRYVLSFKRYPVVLFNVCNSTVMMYIMPAFAVISTMIVLSRDHGDNFYEIEKAAGVKPFEYIFGRFCAISSINFIVALAAILFGAHFYVYSRGGVEHMGTLLYIYDSTLRILRLVLFRAMPTLIMYIGITYLVGTILKNAVSAAILSLSYIVVYFVGNLLLRARITPVYFDYFSPLPTKLGDYLYYYDTVFFSKYINQHATSFSKATFCVLFLVGVGVTGILISYLLTRKRDK